MNIPEGWKLVPVEPTDHMRGLGRAMQLGGTATARNIVTKDENGKIRKPKDWKGPDLSLYVNGGGE